MYIANSALTLAEQCVRQIYFRSSAIRKLRAKPQEPLPRTLDLEAFRSRLHDVGIGPGASVMVHAALGRIRIKNSSEDKEIINPIAVAEHVIATIRSVVGKAGTILMPAFPKYANEPDYFDFDISAEQLLKFDPVRTKSKSGVLSEVFRKQPGTLRSEFPLQTVCAQGQLARDFIDRNIEDGGGLAHGPNSPYGRLVQQRGHVISIGVPLIDYATIIHAPEDARFQTWPRRDFWRTRWFYVVRKDGVERVAVLERHPKYSRGYGEERVRRDLRAARILDEGAVSEVEVHALRADRLFEYFMQKNENSTYPYFWPHISSL
jgi:aminoglycoside N3'-acetyltransferase